jgi:phosphoribosyl-ATP pyrophosphohydrolase/phosphoribosyl-AMP cyclohydrolase
MTRLTADLSATLDWSKGGGQIPAIIQHEATLQVLMLGYMTQESLAATFSSGFVTFFSRSRQALWQKGESSGHTLALREVSFDCDKDALLVKVRPHGPTCHTGAVSCFGDGDGASGLAFLDRLSAIIDARADAPAGTPSYTRQLLDRGVLKQAQKVGEEGVEVALAGAAQDDQALLGESADLLFHLMVLLKGRNLRLEQVVEVLAARHRA